MPTVRELCNFSLRACSNLNNINIYVTRQISRTTFNVHSPELEVKNANARVTKLAIANAKSISFLLFAFAAFYVKALT